MRAPLLYLLFFISGAAGLIYELVWMRELIFVFGGTTYAITTVLVAFMGGLGLGSFVAGRLSHRLRRPGVAYGVLEIIIGLYALAVSFLFAIGEPLYRALYPMVAEAPLLLTLARFVLSTLVLIIPTTCMGATLPVLVRYVTHTAGRLGRSVGTLYGVNTLGAVAGVAAAGFVLMPTLGLTHTTWLAAGGNLVIGLLALVLLRRRVEAPASSAMPDASTAMPPAPMTLANVDEISTVARRAVLIGYAISGFAAMAYQIAWTRALILSIGSSTYSFTCILAAFILGLATGSLAMARFADRWRNPVAVLGWLELAIGIVAMLIVPIHERVPLLVHALVSNYAQEYDALLLVEFLLVMAVTFVPTFLMGALFPLVIRALARRGEEAPAVTGRVYAVNTLGTIAGSFLTGFVLIRSDVLGVQASIILACLLNGLVGVALVTLSQPLRGELPWGRMGPAAAALLVIPAVAFQAGRWDASVLTSAPFLERGSFAEFLRHRRVHYYAEGVDMTVAVTYQEGHEDSITLTVNGKPDASTLLMDMITQLNLGHIPGMLVPEGRSACVIGLGSGMTLSALSRYPSYETLDCVEISEEVIEADRYFAPYNYHVLTQDPRVRLIRADGRNHLLLTDQRYDVIVSEPSNPWISGVANLFTREFFTLCDERLTEDGVLAIWLHGYMMSVDGFRMVVRTLYEVFPEVSIWELWDTDYLLVARRKPLALDATAFIERFRQPTVITDLYRVGISHPGHMLGRYITSGETLRRWVDGAPVHTDDNALLEFQAPRYMYLKEEQALARGFVEMQRDPLEDVLAAAGAPPPRDLVERTLVTVLVRSVRFRAAEAESDEALARELDEILELHQRDPSNTGLYMLVLDGVGRLEEERGGQHGTALRSLRERLQAVRPPTVAPRTGGTASQIVKALEARAAEAGKSGRWPEAARFIEEALLLQPERANLRVALAEARIELGENDAAAAELANLAPEVRAEGAVRYLRGILAARRGAFEQAVEELQAAVATGAVSAAQLAKDRRLALLRGFEPFDRLANVAAGASSTPP